MCNQYNDDLTLIYKNVLDVNVPIIILYNIYIIMETYNPIVKKKFECLLRVPNFHSM